MGKLKVHIGQFYVNGNGEIKPGKSGMVLEIKEFDKLVELIPQIKESIERYELKDTVIPSSPFQLDLPVLDLDTVFLPSPPMQEPTSIPQDEELFDSETKFPHCHSSTLPLKMWMTVPQRNERRKENDQKKLLEVPRRS